jgi:hypothetical protein
MPFWQDMKSKWHDRFPRIYMPTPTQSPSRHGKGIGRDRFPKAATANATATPPQGAFSREAGVL